MTQDEMEGIVARGGGFDFDVTSFSTNQLNGLAARAGSSGATLIMRNVGHLSIEELNGIAARSKGRAIFVI